MQFERFLLVALVSLGGAATARAQPYPGAPPAYAVEPPPGPYDRPPGYRCDARHNSPYGPRGLICPLERPKPVGVRCACRASPAPGYPYGPPIRGHVIP